MEKSSFFNSVGGDRKYKAEDWAEYFRSFVGNGVFADPSDALQVLSGDGMTVSVQPGKGWINGYFYQLTGGQSLTLNNANGTLPRIDRIVLRWSLTERKIGLAISQGLHQKTPVPANLVRNAETFEMCLACITVPAGAINITQANIKDCRWDAEQCGRVTAAVDSVDFTSMNEAFNAWMDSEEEDFSVWRASEENAFRAWVQTLQNVLSGDVAGHLQNEIDSLQAEITGKIITHERVEVAFNTPVTVEGVTENNTVLVTPAPESFIAWSEAQVRCTEQNAGTLTFTCEETPAGTVYANIIIFN